LDDHMMSSFSISQIRFHKVRDFHQGTEQAHLERAISMNGYNEPFPAPAL